MVPRVDMFEETRGDGRRRRPLATNSAQILHHQQCETISTLFAGEPTYTLHLVYFRAFFTFGSVFDH